MSRQLPDAIERAASHGPCSTTRAGKRMWPWSSKSRNALKQVPR